MTHSWVPYVAVAAGAALLLKTVIIIGSGGDEPAITAVLYLGGLLLAIAAAIGTGLRQRRGRRTLVAVGLVILVLAYVMVLTDAVAGVFELFSDKEYVAVEGPLGLMGLVLLALGARSRVSEREPLPA